MSNPNGVAHIRLPNDPRVSYCGRNLSMLFCLQDIEHAEACIANGAAVQPCKRCLKKARVNRATTQTAQAIADWLERQATMIDDSPDSYYMAAGMSRACRSAADELEKESDAAQVKIRALQSRLAQSESARYKAAALIAEQSERITQAERERDALKIREEIGASERAELEQRREAMRNQSARIAELERERDEARAEVEAFKLGRTQTDLLRALPLPVVLEELLDELATTADESFGPFPVQTAKENLTAIQTGIFEQRQRIAELEAALGRIASCGCPIPFASDPCNCSVCIARSVLEKKAALEKARG